MLQSKWIRDFENKGAMFANVTIRPLFKKVVCFWERGSMLLGKSS